MLENTDRKYFNKLASEWDQICTHDTEKINLIVDKLNIKDRARVLDVGTGTGVMIPFILSKLGSKGKIDAIDVSENMLEEAKRKNKDRRTNYIHGDILENTSENIYDNIICYSMFPHFKDRKVEAIEKLSKMLVKGGSLCIAHSQSRDHINSLHQKAGEAVKKDKLPEMSILRDIYKANKLTLTLCIDSEDMYVIAGIK